MEFVLASAIALAIKKVIDTIKMTTAGDFRGALTQLAAWVGGFVAAYVAANTAWASGIEVGGQNLADLNVWSLVLVGLSLGSAASTVHDVVVALNRSGVSVDALPGPERRELRHQTARSIARRDMR